MRKGAWEEADSASPRWNTNQFRRQINDQLACLPRPLTAAVPDCAVSCLQDFVQRNYVASCTSTSDIGFLCSTPNRSGLTIGEGAFQCVLSSCVAPDPESDVRRAYDVCNSVPDALPRTVGTITVTVSTMSDSSTSSETSVSISSAPPPSSTQSTSAQSSSGLTFDPSPSPSPSTGATVSFTGIITASATPTSSHSSSSSSPTAGAGGMMAGNTKGQLGVNSRAGITAGVAVFAALAIGLLLFWLLMRKRARQRQQLSSQLTTPITGPGSALPITTGTSPNRAAKLPSVAPPADTQQNDFARQTMFPTPANLAFAGNTKDYLRSQPQNPWTQSAAMQMGAVPYATPPVGIRVVDQNSRLQHPQHNRGPSADSFKEDVEAQDQDLPALRNSGGRLASSRSSSTELPPPPLMKNAYASTSRITLTPTYDNGTFDNSQPLAQQTEPAPYIPARPTQNASALLPSHNQGGQQQQTAWPLPPTGPSTVPVFPKLNTRASLRVLPTPAPTIDTRQVFRPTGLRKQSVNTDKTLSIVTDFEEDETPPERHQQKSYISKASSDDARGQLRDLRWPQIPQSAATSGAAGIAPRPKGPRPPPANRPPFAPNGHRDQLVAAQTSFIRTDTSSTSNNDESSLNFPLPPRTLGGPQEAQIVGRISAAISKASARSGPQNTYRAPQGPAPLRLEQSRQQPQPQQQRQVAPYSPKKLQKRSSGSLRSPGFVPPPPSAPPPLTPLPATPTRAKVIPKRSKEGDLYLTIDH